jgi:hypothetical protein
MVGCAEQESYSISVRSTNVPAYGVFLFFLLGTTGNLVNTEKRPKSGESKKNTMGGPTEGVKLIGSPGFLRPWSNDLLDRTRL